MADRNEYQLRRLDHIQAIIQRLAGNAFLIKGWALTIVSAMLGVALKDAKSPAIAYLSILPALTFWGLDGYYLAAEIGMRDLYNRGATTVLSGNDEVDVEDSAILSIHLQPLTFRGWLAACVRPVTCILYLLLIGTACILGNLIH